jgi:putative peptide zinc metalloprotease protein
MNITQALNSALPELPARLVGQRYPRIHPEVVSGEHVEGGQRVVRAFVPGVESMFTFRPETWVLVQLFNGQRSYEEVGEMFLQQTGIAFSVDDLRDLAAQIDAMNFWYKTPQEKNIKLMQRTADERRRLLRKKNRWGDLSMVKFPAVDPDRFLSWVHRHVRFVYTTWFTVATLVAFAFTVWVFVTHWSEIGHDTLQFYNFADKTWLDLAEFYLMGCVLLCLHEIGHGLTCKHFGARVPAMGFLLIYLTPAFYTDTTEGDVRGTRFERLMITVSGVWVELILCAIVTPIWWATAPGTAVHNFCYVIILFTGIAVVLINWNPLMKLDGYYMLCDLWSLGDLKEVSTLYASAWVKKNVWRLPVEVPYIPKRRRLGFAVYAVLSGLYGYSILYVFASFIGNIFRNFSPDWAFVFEYGTAYLIFRGRLRALYNFMKFLYLDKKDRVERWFTVRHKVVAAAAVVIFLLLPIWHESADGPFVLEAPNHAAVRVSVPGTVTELNMQEGQMVTAGATLAKLRSFLLESRLARSQADYAQTTAQAITAASLYHDLGTALQDRERLAEQTRELSGEVADLELTSPITGMVVTPRVSDYLGAYVPAGTQIAEIDDLTTLRARIYISEHDISRFQSASRGRLQINGLFGKFNAQGVTIAPAATPPMPGLVDTSKYAGMSAPKFYPVYLTVANANGKLAPGMVGTARLYGRRMTLAGLLLQGVGDLFGRKVW